MKVLVQWATDPPSGWVEVDSQDWASLPKKHEPAIDRKPIFSAKRRVTGFRGTKEVINRRLGWVHRICIQGIVFNSDHIAVINRRGYVEVVSWDDDPGDWDQLNYRATVWKFYPRLVERSVKWGNGIMRFYGPLQKRIIYARKDQMSLIEPTFTTGGRTILKDYATFVPPDEKHIRHGIWLLQDLHDSLEAVPPKQWRDWMPKLPRNPIPHQTITYLLNGAGGTNSDLTPALGNNEQALAARTDTTDISRSVPAATTDEISLSWSTLANNPNVADWPSGDYIGSLEIGAVTATASWKISLLRVNSAGTIQETLGTSASFAATGVSSYTATVDPSAGAAGDRYQLRVLGSNSNAHTTKAFTVTINDPDSQMNGPWVAEPAGTVYLVASTGKRTQVSTGATPIKIDPTTGRRGTSTSFSKYLVRTSDGKLKAQS